MVFTMKALDKHDVLIREINYNAPDLNTLIGAMHDAFQIEGVATVIAHNPNGAFVCALHDTGATGIVSSVATAWWDRPPGAERHERDAVEALDAARRRESLWSEEWSEVEAYGRLRAALRALGSAEADDDPAPVKRRPYRYYTLG